MLYLEHPQGWYPTPKVASNLEAKRFFAVLVPPEMSEIPDLATYFELLTLKIEWLLKRAVAEMPQEKLFAHFQEMQKYREGKTLKNSADWAVALAQSSNLRSKWDVEVGSRVIFPVSLSGGMASQEAIALVQAQDFQTWSNDLTFSDL